MDPRTQAEEFAESAPPPASAPSSRSQVVVPTLAVLAVAGAALLAAFMTRHEPEVSRHDPSSPPPAREVVRAPPLTQAMGAGPACADCGVVESVVVAKPGDGFRMRIRMDDGSLRTLEQRGALASGTRVVVEGSSVKLLPKPG